MHRGAATTKSRDGVHLNSCSLRISRQLEGPRGVEELRRLWIAANALTLWRAQPLPRELCDNRFYDAAFFQITALHGSPKEHLPGAVIKGKPPTIVFIRAWEMTSIASCKLHSLVLCQCRHPNPTPSTNPVAPQPPSPQML